MTDSAGSATSEPYIFPVGGLVLIPPIRECPFIDPEDETCGHPKAATPECHQDSDCPVADAVGELFGWARKPEPEPPERELTGSKCPVCGSVLLDVNTPSQWGAKCSNLSCDWSNTNRWTPS